MPPVRDYTFWTSALEGQRVDHPREEVQCGRYRSRQRDGTDIGIWIDPDEDGWLVVTVGKDKVLRLDTPEKEEDYAMNAFAWFAKRPVTHEAITTWWHEGKWPDDVAEPERRTNGEPDDILFEAIKELRAEAEKWLTGIGGAITCQEHADKAANFATRFRELEQEAEKARTEAKKPILEEGRQIDETWKRVTKAGDAAKRWAQGLPDAWLKAERARKAQEAAAATEAGRAVRPEDLKVKAGTRGRGVSPRTHRELVVTDADALHKHYQDDRRFWLHPDVNRVRGKIATTDLEAGLAVPGAEFRTVESAA